MIDWGRGKVEGEESRGDRRRRAERRKGQKRGGRGRQGLEKGEKPIDLLKPCSRASEEISPFNTI